MRNILSVLAIAILVAGCSLTSGGGSASVVDYSNSPAATEGRDYGTDLAACQSLSSQASGSVEEGAKQGLGGAAIGAAGGAIVGAITGQPGTGAAIGAALGGTGGVARGVSQGADRRDSIVRQCMRDRGWRTY